MLFFFIETAAHQVFPVVAPSLALAQAAVESISGTAPALQNPLFNGHAFSPAEAEATGFLG